MPTAEENAYFAGILDGDGSISIGRAHGIRRKNYQCFPMARIINTHGGVCEFAKRLYGGTVYERKDREKNGHKRIFLWQTSSRKAESFLKLVLPYLVIKRKQAELVLAFYDGTFIHGQQPTEEESNRRKCLAEQVKEFNRRK